MAKSVNLIIDGQAVTVPEGTLVVNAAKMAGIDIPVFCYHPKLQPVGMCRMCLVDIGRPVINRQTNQPELDENGKVKIGFGPKLDTSCTVVVSEGMVVVTDSEKVKASRKEMLEFLLTSHPLDCPVCDKGGECPLQNLTMAYASGTSRFDFTDKKHLGKHVQLGELIWLDRERCIQCARCVRFQDEIVDDPVIDFYRRGRSLEIRTYSEPGFDSLFSGNTTDICPVGALTTADFHFGARPWEMNAAASICSHCPVGCNLEFNVRREARSGGRSVIKRVMPRQNEQVNEIWICDKGRFGYHFTESPARLAQPLVRKNGKLEPASWDEALALVAEKIKAAGASLVTLAGGKLANEDLFNLAELTRAQGGQTLLYSHMAGGELAMQLGLPAGSNLGVLGKGDVIVVAASDLHEEAPLWWLRVKQAAERGAELIVVGARLTRLNKYASLSLVCDVGSEAETLRALLTGATGQKLTGAGNLVVFYGSDGLGLAGSGAVAAACAELLVKTKHAGKLNSGLVPVWSSANAQGAWETGFRPAADLPKQLAGAAVAFIAAADPAGDDLTLGEALKNAGFVVAQELFFTETAKMADVVLPAQAYTEREGSFTSGERRVQRYYPVTAALDGTRADYAIFAQLGKLLGIKLESAPALVMLKMAASLPAFTKLTYQKLAEVTEQRPIIGRSDLYYGGTSYENKQGLGAQLSSLWRGALTPEKSYQQPAKLASNLIIFPVTLAYDRGTIISRSEHLLGKRLTPPALRVNTRTLSKLPVENGVLHLNLGGRQVGFEVVVDDTAPDGLILVPRSAGLALDGPEALELGNE